MRFIKLYDFANKRFKNITTIFLRETIVKINIYKNTLKQKEVYLDCFRVFLYLKLII